MGGPIDLDPASCAEANRTVQAARIHSAGDSGLEHRWKAERIWLNPPFSGADVRAWVATLVEAVKEDRVQQACLLLHASPETRYGQHALGSCAAACWLRGRVRFLGVTGGRGTAQVGQVVLYYGPRSEAFRKAFDDSGVVMVPAGRPDGQ